MQESIQDMSMVHNSRFQSMQDMFIEWVPFFDACIQQNLLTSIKFIPPPPYRILPGEVANQVGAGRDTIKELKERLGNETSKVDACEANNTSLMETHQEQLKAAIAKKDGLLKSMMKVAHDEGCFANIDSGNGDNKYPVSY